MGRRRSRRCRSGLEYRYTRTATGADAAWIAARLESASAPFGVGVIKDDSRLRLRL
jgi:hypothetical protein